MDARQYRTAPGVIAASHTMLFIGVVVVPRSACRPIERYASVLVSVQVHLLVH